MHAHRTDHYVGADKCLGQFLRLGDMEFRLVVVGDPFRYGFNEGKTVRIEVIERDTGVM